MQLKPSIPILKNCVATSTHNLKLSLTNIEGKLNDVTQALEQERIEKEESAAELVEVFGE